jgi:hypothetical protein
MRPWEASAALAALVGQVRKKGFWKRSPGEAGDSNLQRHERATRDVRSDRVGAKIPPRAIAMGGARGNAGAKRTRALGP